MRIGICIASFMNMAKAIEGGKLYFQNRHNTSICPLTRPQHTLYSPTSGVHK